MNFNFKHVTFIMVWRHIDLGTRLGYAPRVSKVEKLNPVKYRLTRDVFCSATCIMYNIYIYIYIINIYMTHIIMYMSVCSR